MDLLHPVTNLVHPIILMLCCFGAIVATARDMPVRTTLAFCLAAVISHLAVAPLLDAASIAIARFCLGVGTGCLAVTLLRGSMRKMDAGRKPPSRSPD